MSEWELRKWKQHTQKISQGPGKGNQGDRVVIGKDCLVFLDIKIQTLLVY